MNETPPMPQPSGATCPNCGSAQNANAPYCTNCGAPLPAATPSGSLSRASKTIVSIALGCGALLFGAFGACVAFLTRIEAGSMDITSLALIIVPALLALACLWGIFRVLRK